ncbi:MAG: dTDP-4-dehydrorhamnose 3,5-epimerase [Pseudomonadota bacterium]
MEFIPLEIPGLCLIKPRQFTDGRGVFWESFKADRYKAEGIEPGFVQDNTSRSARAGTVRGLHFQAPPAAQSKLVQCMNGSIFDVAVDIRAQSPYYGQAACVELTAEKGEQLYVPAGFAHGFMTLTDEAVVSYKVSAPYAPETEGGLPWDDPTLAIPWPKQYGPVSLSDRDGTWPGFKEFRTPFEDLVV